MFWVEFFFIGSLRRLNRSLVGIVLVLEVFVLSVGERCVYFFVTTRIVVVTFGVGFS